MDVIQSEKAEAATAGRVGSPTGGSEAGLDCVLEARGLSKAFGAVQALDGMDLKVRRGSVHGFIGPNGAGKTTTFSILAGYLSPDSGEVLVNGVHPAGPKGRRGVLGILPQDARLPEKDIVGDLLTFYGRLQGMDRTAARSEAKAWLERVGMQDAWSKRCGTLSHGMQKRVGIAQAFMGSPAIVLLDEPTAGLDPANASQLRDLIRKANAEGQSILISSHNLSELEALCDAATIVDHGRVRASGTMDVLTGSLTQVRIQVAMDNPPLDALAECWAVHGASFEPQSRSLKITLAPGLTTPETGINEALKILIGAGVPISGVSKGDTLESTVIALGSGASRDASRGNG